MFLFVNFFVLSAFSSSDIDENLADALKNEANHNLKRLRSFEDEQKSNRIFDQERENGLGEFLEDQERWELYRSRGLQEYRKTQKDKTPEEGSPEHLADLEEKESQVARYERSRQIHVRTKEKYGSVSNSPEVEQIESMELGLINDRPRYDLRKRGNNKWVDSGKKSGSFGSTGGSQPSFQPPPAPTSDYNPPPEFPPAPAPYDGIDDNQVVVPPPVYDGTSSGDLFNTTPDFGIPPPPPPPPDFDF